MTLVSPGVKVSIVDQSQYLPAPTNTIPFILFATAQNKADPTSTAVAAGTTAANAGQLYLITSQRDLVSTYGNPFFYNTTNGTPINGYELNEYGLLAAYSALGVTNQVYCLRADIDLASLVGSTGRPTGAPDNGTYWLDTTSSTWGIYEFNNTTGQFVLQTPLVITDTAQISGGFPLNSLGSIGQYAVIANPTYTYASSLTTGTYFYKNYTNTWVLLGSGNWLGSRPTVWGTQTNPALTANNTFVINVNGGSATTITVPGSPNNNVNGMVTAINALNQTYLHAASVGGQLQIFSKQTGNDITVTTPPQITISAGSGTVLADLGITAGTYYQPTLFYGTSAQQPLWQSDQTYPRPTGSVWIKVGSAGNGFNPVVSTWNNTLAVWQPQTVTSAVDDGTAIAALDSTGGQTIPAGTVYAQYNYDSESSSGVNQGCVTAPIYYWERISNGPTVVVGSNTTPVFNTGPYTATVTVSTPGEALLSGPYTVSLANATVATDFVTSWSAADIPYTQATVSSTGAIQLTHTAGGVIQVNDVNTTTGFSNGLMLDAGFVVGSTAGVKEGAFASVSFTPSQASTTGVGTGLVVNVTNVYQNYFVKPSTFANPGTGYVVGDKVTFSGASLGGTSPANDLVIVITATNIGNGAVEAIGYYSGRGPISYTTMLSNWQEFTLDAQLGNPVVAPLTGTNWFYSVVDQVDIMVNTASGWVGYKNTNYNSSGFPIPTGSNATDPNGPLVSASAPLVQSDGTALVYGDIWINTSDLENYPIINRWQLVSGIAQWVVLNNTDSIDSSGVIFQDARWAPNGTTDPVQDPIPTIVSLLSSNYLDLDAPVSALYPTGMLLFNTRRSGYNVKQYIVDYFNNNRFPDQETPEVTDAWVTASGLQSNGAPYMGRKAQRAMVVKSLGATINTNTAILDEDNFFNLIATPNYPELQPDMVTLNDNRGQTAYIIGDTPMRLPNTATAITAWAHNTAGADTTGEDGLVTVDTYLGLFYPSGTTTDLSGNIVAVPPSHMMIRTFLRNDNIAYPWFAAAGTRRGIIDNATSIGYVNAQTGNFVSIKTSQGIRDVLYENQINPLVYFTGNGLLCYGNKTSFASNSALDRINVARLIAYMSRTVALAARPFVFEPNDSLTRTAIAGIMQSLCINLVATRGIYDYLVVCDTSNNTPTTINENQLWVDIAIEPVKAVEFIYIPIRILATGSIGNNSGS